MPLYSIPIYYVAAKYPLIGSYTPGAKIKLDEICKIIGLPGKPSGIDGSEVEVMIRAGRIAEVAQYCESDVLNTYRLWLVFRGSITAEQLAFSETQAVEFVRTGKSDNPHLLTISHGNSDKDDDARSPLSVVLQWLPEPDSRETEYL